MTKQLMIYNDIQPLSEKHLKWSVNIENYEFISHLNAVPVLANEILSAAPEFPIVFSAVGNTGEFIPLALMGLKDEQNLFLDDKNMLITRYIPAFIRRYPFVLSTSTTADVMAICIDEGSKVTVSDGSKGLRLFEENGEQSVHLKSVTEFLKDYHYRAEITKVFCKSLSDLGLLEPMNANITFKDNEAANVNLTGFYIVKHEALKALKDADVLDLFRKDGLELIHAHIQSVANFNRLIDLMSKRLAV